MPSAVGVVDRDHADVVEHRLAAVGGAAREVDLELPRQPLRDRVAQEVPEGGVGPRLDVEHLVGARAGEVAAHDVAHRVRAGLAGGEAHLREVPQQVGHPLQVDEVELHVLASGQVAPAAAVLLGDGRERVELVRGDRAVGRLDADHLVVAALALAVDAVGQAEDLEDVLVDVAGQVAGQATLELADVGDHAGVHVDGGVGAGDDLAVGVDLDRAHGVLRTGCEIADKPDQAGQQ